MFAWYICIYQLRVSFLYMIAPIYILFDVLTYFHTTLSHHFLNGYDIFFFKNQVNILLYVFNNIIVGEKWFKI